jgi:hypothetical protein
MNNQNRKVIRSSRVAKQLLEQGERIIDIAEDRADPKRTVFVFEYTDTLNELLTNSNKKEV